MGHQIYDLQSFTAQAEAENNQHPRFVGLVLVAPVAPRLGIPASVSTGLRWFDHRVGLNHLTCFTPVSEWRNTKGSCSYRHCSDKVARVFGISAETLPGVVLMSPSLEDQALYLPLQPGDYRNNVEALSPVLEDLSTLLAAALAKHQLKAVPCILKDVQNRFNRPRQAGNGPSRVWKGQAGPVPYSLARLNRLGIYFFKSARRGVGELVP